MKKKILLIIGLCLIFLTACSPSDKKEEPKSTEDQVDNKDVNNEEKTPPEDNKKPEEAKNKETEPVEVEKPIESEKPAEEPKAEETKPEEPKPEEAKPTEEAKPEAPNQEFKPEQPARKIAVGKDFEADLYMIMLFQNKDNFNYTYNKEITQNIKSESFSGQVLGQEKVMYDGKLEVKHNNSKSQNQESITNTFTDVSGNNHVVYTQVLFGGNEKITKNEYKTRRGNMPLFFDTQFDHMHEKYKWNYDEALSKGNIMAFTKLVKDAQIDEYNSNSMGQYKNSKGHIKSTLFMNTDTGMVDSFIKEEKFVSDFTASKEAKSYGAVSGKIETDTTSKYTDIQFGKAPKLSIPEEVIKNAIKAN